MTMTANAESKDEDITTDDLLAMKAMIGDIKKDPSLLFRLTSLSIDVNNFSGGIPTATNTCNTGSTAIVNNDSNHNNTNTNNGDMFVVDDDTTVVSALTMPSVGDWTNGGYSHHQLPHHGISGAGEATGRQVERHTPTSPTFRMGRGQYQTSSTFAQATATAVTGSNHDAAIALRMQKLRAQRAGTSARRTNQTSVGSNSPQVMSNNNRLQNCTTPMKTLPSISDEGRDLARTPSPGGTRQRTNYSPKRSSARPGSTSRAMITPSSGLVNHGDDSGNNRRQRQGQKETTTDDNNIEAKSSRHAGTLVLYERNEGNSEIDTQTLKKRTGESSSQAIATRGNRYGKESATHNPDAQPRQRPSQLSSALVQHSLISSPKSNKFHDDPAPRSTSSRRTSSRINSDRRRETKSSSTLNTVDIEKKSSNSKALIASFSSSSPALMPSALQSDSALNPNELNFNRRRQSVGMAGNDRSNSVTNRHIRGVSSSNSGEKDRKQSSSSSSHRSKHKIRYQSPPVNTTSAVSRLTPILSPGEGGKSSGEGQLAEHNLPTPKSEGKAAKYSHLTTKDSQSMKLPFTNDFRRWSSDEMNDSFIEQELLHHHTKSKGTRARAETEPTTITPVEGSELPDKTIASEGNDEVSNLVNDHHMNAGQLIPQSPLPVSTSQSSLGHRLAQLSMLDRSKQHHDQRSDRSEGGRSVISRLFSPMKRSVSSHDDGWVGDGGYSPMANADNNSSQSFHGIVSLKSQSASAGLVNASDDSNGRNRFTVPALVNHESHHKISEYRRNVSNDDELSDHVAAGSTSTRGPKFCDDRGRCQLHSHIRLLKPKMFGGWKVLLQYCPDCVLEELKKNQENLTKIQLQQKREDDKKRRRSKKERERHHSIKPHADPMIGKDVGNVEFTPYSENAGKSKSRHHTRDKDRQKDVLKQEELIQEGSPAPLEDVLEKFDPVVHGDQQIDLEPETCINNKDTDEQVLPPPPPQPQVETPPVLSTDSNVPHQELSPKRVNGLPWIDYNGNSGRYTGAVNEQYVPNGQGVMIYDGGSISAGIWYNGVLDTEDAASRSRIAVTEAPVPIIEQPPAPARILPNYAIGDTGRVEDMIIDSKKVIAALIAETRAGDAAFVCRTDGRWTYAIAKSRTYGDNPSIKFKVNLRGSTKAFPSSQWGGFVRPIRQSPLTGNGDGDRSRSELEDRASTAATRKSSHTNSLSSLGDFLDSQKNNGSSSSVAGNFMRQDSDVSISSFRSVPDNNVDGTRGVRQHRSMQNLTTAKMKIPSRSRSRSRSRQRSLSTSFPNLLSSDMSVSEEAVDGQISDVWETASGSGYRLRGIDP